MANKTILTAAGLKKLQDELNELKNVKSQENAERIKVAISYGDISENSEYDDAKNEQAFIAGRILELEQMINTAVVIEDKDTPADVVGLGSHVTVEDLAPEDGDEPVQEFEVVGTTEADPFEGRISNDSPIGLAIMGKKVGDEVLVRTPVDDHKYRIIAVK